VGGPDRKAIEEADATFGWKYKNFEILRIPSERLGQFLQRCYSRRLQRLRAGLLSGPNVDDEQMQ
jgi:hypothetical protein